MLLLPMTSELSNSSFSAVIPTSKLNTVQVAALDEDCNCILLSIASRQARGQIGKYDICQQLLFTVEYLK